MRTTDTIFAIHQKRGTERLPLERVYRQLYDRELYLKAYGKIYRNFGAITRASTLETVDSMDLQKIDTIIGLLKMGKYEWTPVRRTYLRQ